ncbi:MAG: hypothetical protein FWE33_04610 [Defluviitaleaceae bacterium]|nr:hypothetical protein [Defluviitaleaceae bacterium]
MKLKTLAKVCRKEGFFALYDKMDNDGKVVEQWLGCWGAVYVLPDLPHLTAEHIPRLFDLTAKQLGKITIKQQFLPENYNFDHDDKNESVCEREKMTIGYDGRILRPIMTKKGLELIDDDYLSPLDDVADELGIYERRTESGRAYFALKVGFLVVGIIMPYDGIDEILVEEIEKMAFKSRKALEAKVKRQKKTKEWLEDEMQDMQ